MLCNAGGASFVMMSRLGGTSLAGAVLVVVTLPACKRAPEQSARSSDNSVRKDVKDVARTTEKTAKDLGHAAAAGQTNAMHGVVMRSLLMAGTDKTGYTRDTANNLSVQVGAGVPSV